MRSETCELFGTPVKRVMSGNKKNGTRVDVREVYHRAWGVAEIQRITHELQSLAADLYSKLLDAVPVDKREQAVRCRIFADYSDATRFSNDHPRLFSMVTSERYTKTPALQKQLREMFATKLELEKTGGMDSRRAHEQFIQSTMTANTKPAPAPPPPLSDDSTR